MRRVLSTTIGFAIAAGAPAHLALADDLYVGSSSGSVLRANTEEAVFRFGGVCAGPINSMAAVAGTLMIGDNVGNVYGLDMEGGGVGYYFTLPGSDNTAIVAHNATLLISDLAGDVRRVDPTNGAVLAIYTSPIRILAMARDESFLYVAGPEGSIYRAPLASGEFSYFACACLGPINSLAVRSDDVIAGDKFGSVMRFDRTNGNILGFFTLPGDNTAMAATPSGIVYVSDTRGDVRRVDPDAGRLIDTIPAGVPVKAMVFVPDHTACRADLNADGAVNSQDFFSFLQMFLDGDPAADFNADSHINSADFFDYLNAFFTPCA